MAKIKIQQFKGLLNYGDLADSSLEYASQLSNVKIYPGYIESIGYKLNKIDIDIPSTENLIKIFYAFLDKDKFKNKVSGNNLIRDYIQDINKHKIIITEEEENDYSKYYIYVDDNKIDFVHIGSKNQTPQYENSNGILKIFFKETSYYLSKFERYIKRYVVTPVFSQWTFQEYNGIKINRLIHREQNNVFPFNIEQISSDPETTIPIRLEIVGTTLYQWQGVQFAVLSCRVINKLTDETIIYPSVNGYFNYILMMSSMQLYDDPPYYGYFFGANVREAEIITNFRPENFPGKIYDNKSYKGSFVQFYRNLEKTELFSYAEGEDFYLFGTNQAHTNYSNLILDNLEINLLKLQSYSNEFKFPAVTTSEFVVTINNSQGEYIHSVKSFDGYIENFLFKISGLDTSTIPEDITQINLYLSTKLKVTEDNLFEIKQHDLVLSISLVEDKLPNFPIYIDQLTPKGIYLVQRIGMPYSPVLYKLVDGFTQYKTINGISFAINNDRIYYPAVGNATVLNNIFYENNYIPSVEGQIITEISKKLGIIDTNKGIIQIIDFQPVETTLLFIPIINYDSKVKDYFDIIYTEEGTIFNTSDGILVTNSQNREIISNNIKNIIIENFDKSKIFYNRYKRELYYTYDNQLYIFNFSMFSWSSVTILDRLDGEIKDIIEDYEGNFYFVIIDNRNKMGIYKLEEYLTYASVKYSTINLGEITFKKAIKHISFDFEGEVIYNDIKRLSDRRVTTTIPINLLQRKFKDHLDIGYSFKGKIYSFEIDLDITPHIKY